MKTVAAEITMVALCALITFIATAMVYHRIDAAAGMAQAVILLFIAYYLADIRARI